MPIIEAGFKFPDGTVNFNYLITYGPTVKAIVSSSPSFSTETNEITDLKSTNGIALVDTGACSSMIDQTLIDELGLIALDKVIISGVSGSAEHLVYLAAISVPELDIHHIGQFTAANLKAGGQAHNVLLGRDFLSKIIMIYDGFRGQITLASAKL